MNHRIQLFLAIAAAFVLNLTLQHSAFGQPRMTQASRYTVTDLSTLPGGVSSFGFDINNAGWVAGSSSVTPDGSTQHASLWYSGQVIDLGTLGGANSGAGGPNASLEAIVSSESAVADPNGEEFCGYGNHVQCLAAIWRNGTLQALPLLPGGNNSQAFGINDGGQVIGFAENGIVDTNCATPSQVKRFVPVIWDRGTGKIRQLSPLAGDTVAFGFGINESGQSVGGSGLCSDTVIPPFQSISAPHAVLWEREGTPVDLGGLGGAVNIASAINNRGDVDGTAELPDGSVHAFLWDRRSGMQDLGTLPGDFGSVAPCCRTINDKRQVVGFSISAKGPRAFISQAGQMADLNDLAPGSPMYLLVAQSVNARGQIAGFGVTGNGELHAFLATPNADR